jgi:hypothetical protein
MRRHACPNAYVARSINHQAVDAVGANRHLVSAERAEGKAVSSVCVADESLNTRYQDIG